MPDAPREGETESDFMSRCVAELESEGAEADVADARCHRIFEEARTPSDPSNPQMEENRRKLGL